MVQKKPPPFSFQVAAAGWNNISFRYQAVMIQLIRLRYPPTSPLFNQVPDFQNTSLGRN